MSEAKSSISKLVKQQNKPGSPSALKTKHSPLDASRKELRLRQLEQNQQKVLGHFLFPEVVGGDDKDARLSKKSKYDQELQKLKLNKSQPITKNNPRKKLEAWTMMQRDSSYEDMMSRNLRSFRKMDGHLSKLIQANQMILNYNYGFWRMT